MNSNKWRWAIWYTNQTFTGSTADEFAVLPKEGVIAVKTWSGEKTGNIYYSKILTGDRWYFLLGEFIASDTTKNEEELLARYPNALYLKRGVWVPDDVMSRVQQEAFNARYPING